MNACVESQSVALTNPAVAAMRASTAPAMEAEENERGADAPRYIGADEETVAKGESASPAALPAEEANRVASDSPSPDAALPKRPQAEPEAEKNPWCGCAWLGLCK